jgi:hypothetical protein
MDICHFIIENKDLILFISTIIFGAGFGRENFSNLKKESIFYTEKIVNDSSYILSSKAKMDIAIDYFYDNYLTKFIPRWFISLFIPRDRIHKIIQNEFDQIILIGQKRAIEKLNKLKD